MRARHCEWCKRCTIGACVRPLARSENLVEEEEVEDTEEDDDEDDEENDEECINARSARRNIVLSEYQAGSSATSPNC